MVSGLLFSFKSGSDLKFDNVSVKENFGDLGFRSKYCFDLVWYAFGENIEVIFVDGCERGVQIFLADNRIEAEAILNEVVLKVVADFGVSGEDEKAIFDRLRQHGCCYF